MALSKDEDILLTDWFRRSRESQSIHYDCAGYYSRLNYWLGIPTIVLSTAVGTTVFASLDASDSHTIRIVVGLISILAAVLASLQTFLRLSERAEHHRTIAASYAAIRRSLEYLKTFPSDDVEEVKRAFEEIKKQMDKLAEDAPSIPLRMKGKFKELKNREHKRIFHLPPTP